MEIMSNIGPALLSTTYQYPKFERGVSELRGINAYYCAIYLFLESHARKCIYHGLTWHPHIAALRGINA